jgi:hypothetical protein
MRVRRLVVMALVLSCLQSVSTQAAWAGVPPAASCTREATLFSNNNPAGVLKAPIRPTRFDLASPSLITYVMTYHWNDGRGRKPGKITLRHQDGSSHGPWKAVGDPGQGGVPNAYWVVRPGVILKAGSYTVIDSHASSWAQNAESGGQGIAELRGCPANEPPSSGRPVQ